MTKKKQNSNKKNIKKKVVKKNITLNPKLESINKELQEYKNKNLRLLADFENFKKRIERNNSDSYNRNLEEFILSFLPVIDDFERVIDHKNTNNEQLVIDSISMIKSKIDKILNKYNINAFVSKDDNFNPELHEAIMAQNSNKKNNIIIDEFEKGYKIKDKVIRHAKVIVSKGKK